MHFFSADATIFKKKVCTNFQINFKVKQRKYFCISSKKPQKVVETKDKSTKRLIYHIFIY